MMISPINCNYNTYPNFRGKSRELEKVLDVVLEKGVATPEDNKLIIEKIKAALNDILKPSRFIEEGSHKAVYKITSKYAARVPIMEKLTPKNIGNAFEWGQNRFKAMKNYFGEPILQLGQFQLLRNIGINTPAGVPEHLAKKFGKGQLNKYYLYKYLPLFAQVSQQDYIEFAKNLDKLNGMKFGARMYGVFDSLNPNNIVMSGGKLFLVDEIDLLCDKSYANTTAKLLNVFINRASKDYEAPDAGKRINLVRRIFKKVLISGVVANLVHAVSKEDFRCWEIALQKCKITNTPASEVLNMLEDITCSKVDEKEKINMTTKYLITLFGKNPTNK